MDRWARPEEYKAVVPVAILELAADQGGLGTRQGHGDAVGRLQSHLVAASDQFLAGHDRLRHHSDVDNALVAQFPRPQGFRHKIQRWNLVPLRIKRAQNLFGPIAVTNDFNVSGAVIDE